MCVWREGLSSRYLQIFLVSLFLALFVFETSFDGGCCENMRVDIIPEREHKANLEKVNSEEKTLYICQWGDKTHFISLLKSC